MISAHAPRPFPAVPGYLPGRGAYASVLQGAESNSTGGCLVRPAQSITSCCTPAQMHAHVPTTIDSPCAPLRAAQSDQPVWAPGKPSRSCTLLSTIVPLWAQVARPAVHDSGHIIWQITDPALVQQFELQAEPPADLLAALLQPLSPGGAPGVPEGFRPPSASFSDRNRG